MKPDTERKKYYSEKLHKRKKRLHVHLSKDLKTKLKQKKRSLQVRKGDTVKVMRGPHKGKEAKVSRVNTNARKVFLEGVTVTNTRAREMFVALEPSNLLLLSLEPSKERKKMFSEDAFAKKKAESKKEEKPKEAEKHKHAEGEKHAHKHSAEEKHEHKPAEYKSAEQKHVEKEKHEHKPAEHKSAEKEKHEHKPAEHKTMKPEAHKAEATTQR